MPATRLTKEIIDGLAWSGRTTVVRDARVTGLLVVVNKGGKSYAVQRDLWRGRPGARVLVKTVRHVIGRTDEMSLEDARDRAADVIRLIKRGIDPNARDEAPPAAGMWTVGRLYAEYAADQRARGLSERTVTDALDRLERYLPDWRDRLLTDVKRSDARAAHQRITRERGRVVANATMRDLRACWNFAVRILDDTDALPGNPVAAVTFNPQPPSERVLPSGSLEDWWAKVGRLDNPLRRAFFRLCLLSGARPGLVARIERSWLRLEEHAIEVPRGEMKSRRPWAMPLSPAMERVIRDALAAGDVLYPGSRWLFPTRARDSRDVIHLQSWREPRSLPGETGHLTRRTYRTLAARIGVAPHDARLLLDHAVPGVDGIYVHSGEMFPRLLREQRRLSRAILRECRAWGRRGEPRPEGRG